MPFLRRRGNAASESDMRRHSLLDPLAAPAPKQPPPPFHSGSTTELPVVAEDLSASSIPPTSTDLPRDSISVASTYGGVPSIIEPSGPGSHAGSDYSNKHRRFSMLRFRNASDSQLAAKAKLHAAAQKPPPVPRRMCPAVTLPVAQPRTTIPSRYTNTWNGSSRDHHHRPNLPPRWPPKEDVPDELHSAIAPVWRDIQGRGRRCQPQAPRPRADPPDTWP